MTPTGLKNPPLHHAAVEGAAVVVPRPAAAGNAIATLFTSHILQDGEIVQLILKPSGWFILISCLKFFAGFGIVICAAILFARGNRSQLIVNVSLLLMALRLMWAVLVWMGQVYVLTDQRVMTLTGVLLVDVWECPLRRVARARIIHSTRERILRLGTIQIIPMHEDQLDGHWQSVANPKQVRDLILAAVARTKQGGH